MGGYDAKALQAAGDDVLSAGKLTSPGAADGSAKISLYQLLHAITEPNLG